MSTAGTHCVARVLSRNSTHACCVRTGCNESTPRAAVEEGVMRGSPRSLHLLGARFVLGTQKKHRKQSKEALGSRASMLLPGGRAWSGNKKAL